MVVLLFFAFLAGFVTILAPCIWPLLPIVLSASSVVGKQRPLGITLGVMTSFTVLTLSVSYLEQFLHVDPNVFRLIAVVVIALLGISMAVPPLAARLESVINRLLAPLHGRIQQRGNGFWAGYGTGFSIGVVWAPCAGPILATVATLAATEAVNLQVVLVTLAYVGGLGVPLFLFSLAGSRWFARMRRVTPYTGRIQQAFGVIMIAAAMLIYTNYDKTLQVKILNLFPSYGNAFNAVENNAAVTKELASLRGEKETAMPAVETRQAGRLPDLGPAPDFTGITHWLNSKPLTMKELRGKVVLVDFWTYSCVNCVRTLPHVTGWYAKYKDKGFVVVGVHTPEFAFEKKTRNVASALKQFHIHYPVAQDNNYGTWRAYANHYWPAEYLIDVHGHIRREHFGEGEYDKMEEAIRRLLREAGRPVSGALSSLKDATPRYPRTPETYLGLARMERFASNEPPVFGEQTFTAPAQLPLNDFAYEGPWNLTGQAATAGRGAALVLHFYAEKVFLVIGPGTAGERVRVFLDGKPVGAAAAGADVKNGRVILDRDRLYNLINLRGDLGAHVLRLEFENSSTAVYAFTFG